MFTITLASGRELTTSQTSEGARKEAHRLSYTYPGVIIARAPDGAPLAAYRGGLRLSHGSYKAPTVSVRVVPSWSRGTD